MKTLQDAAASTVDLTQARATTVRALRRLKVPNAWSIDTPRLDSVETTVYRVDALLRSMKREDDSDIHLVIADPKVGGSMIAEFPASSCDTTASTQAQTVMAQARAAIASACGGEPHKSFVTLQGRATITGVGFFDALHGQGGVAPNGIELHPVIGFQVTTCTRVKP